MTHILNELSKIVNYGTILFTYKVMMILGCSDLQKPVLLQYVSTSISAEREEHKHKKFSLRVNTPTGLLRESRRRSLPWFLHVLIITFNNVH